MFAAPTSSPPRPRPRPPRQAPSAVAHRRLGRTSASGRAHARWKDDHVVLAREVSRVEALRVHDLERELELFEQPARPAGRHRPAVLIRERDAQLAELDRVGGVTPEGAGRSSRPDPSPSSAVRRGVRHAGSRRRRAALRPHDLASGRKQAVDGDERVVRRVAQDHRGRSRRRTLPGGGFCRPLTPLERSVEPVEDAIELHAHLIRQRPAGVVVRAGRRPARIRECRRDGPAARTCRARAAGMPARSSRRTSPAG